MTILDKIDKGINSIELKRDIVLKARQDNTKIISWKDGKIIETDPWTIDIDDSNVTGSINEW